MTATSSNGGMRDCLLERVLVPPLFHCRYLLIVLHTCCLSPRVCAALLVSAVFWLFWCLFLNCKTLHHPARVLLATLQLCVRSVFRLDAIHRRCVVCVLFWLMVWFSLSDDKADCLGCHVSLHPRAMGRNSFRCIAALVLLLSIVE